MRLYIFFGFMKKCSEESDWLFGRPPPPGGGGVGVTDWFFFLE